MPPLSKITSLSDMLAHVPPRTDAKRWNFHWAFDHYEATLLTLAAELKATRLCEIGGGRDPAFKRDQVTQLGLDYTVNDIDANELALAPAGFRTACFDISGDISHISPGSYDLMFSRMVFEHVNGVERAWSNIHTLLAPGGAALAFFPTMYAWPFVLNRMIPERVSQGLLNLFSRDDRSAEGNNPKFPALYDWTFGSQTRLAPMLGRAGFTDIHVAPFWGHDYLRRIPLARTLDDAYTRFCVARDWRLQTTYAYALVRKA